MLKRLSTAILLLLILAAGGCGSDAGCFMKHDYGTPALGLLTDEGSPIALVRRELTIDTTPQTERVYSNKARVTDTYRLKNTTSKTQTVRVGYPYVTSLYADEPPLAIDLGGAQSLDYSLCYGRKIDTSLYGDGDYDDINLSSVDSSVYLSAPADDFMSGLLYTFTIDEATLPHNLPHSSFLLKIPKQGNGGLYSGYPFSELTHKSLGLIDTIQSGRSWQFYSTSGELEGYEAAVLDSLPGGFSWNEKKHIVNGVKINVSVESLSFREYVYSQIPDITDTEYLVIAGDYAENAGGVRDKLIGLRHYVDNIGRLGRLAMAVFEISFAPDEEIELTVFGSCFGFLSYEGEQKANIIKKDKSTDSFSFFCIPAGMSNWAYCGEFSLTIISDKAPACGAVKLTKTGDNIYKTPSDLPLGDKIVFTIDN